jgi:hypothetical protein
MLRPKDTLLPKLTSQNQNRHWEFSVTDFWLNFCRKGIPSLRSGIIYLTNNTYLQSIEDCVDRPQQSG